MNQTCKYSGHSKLQISCPIFHCLGPSREFVPSPRLCNQWILSVTCQVRLVLWHWISDINQDSGSVRIQILIEIFCDFLQCLEENATLVPQIKSWSLLHNAYQIGTYNHFSTDDTVLRSSPRINQSKCDINFMHIIPIIHKLFPFQHYWSCVPGIS
jgi:hypothetical protein